MTTFKENDPTQKLHIERSASISHTNGIDSRGVHAHYVINASFTFSSLGGKFKSLHKSL